MDPLQASSSPDVRSDRLWITAFAAFLGIMALTAQTTPITRAVQVHQSNGLVTPESASFFADNITIADDVLVRRVNGVANNLSLEGISVVVAGGGLALQPGSGLTAPSGAPVAIHTLIIGNPYATASAPEPVRKADFDLGIIPLVGNRTALRNLPIPTGGALPPSVFRRATVLANTVTAGIADGAKGDWYWDPASTLAEGPVVQKSNLLPDISAGRWIKL